MVASTKWCGCRSGWVFDEIVEKVGIHLMADGSAGEVSFSTNVPGGQLYARFSVQLSDFPGFDFSDVDGIRYEFTALVGSTSMTIEFLDVSSIPEPASIALFGVLSLTLLRRRR